MCSHCDVPLFFFVVQEVYPGWPDELARLMIGALAVYRISVLVERTRVTQARTVGAHKWLTHSEFTSAISCSELLLWHQKIISLQMSSNQEVHHLSLCVVVRICASQQDAPY